MSLTSQSSSEFATAANSFSPLPTSLEEAEAIAVRLTNRKRFWSQVSIPERIAYLHRCIEGVSGVAQIWAEVACRAKGIDPDSALAGEEWLAGPAATLWHLRSLIRTLQANGQPQPINLTTRQGQPIAQVFPDSLLDRLLWRGFSGEVWMQPGYPPVQGSLYQKSVGSSSVALVLGAGNVSSIAPLDALYKLFAENAVVLLKLNPVNEYMGPVLEVAFEPLRQEGLLEIVYGGAELGGYLCQHPLIDSIHITGSQQTHDAIVWGSDTAEQIRRKALNQPATLKPITSELGCVTPVLVVPGNWSEADLAVQARHVAGMVVHNASFNCAAAKVIVTANGWAQRQAFLEHLQRELAITPSRLAYYPGAQQRFQAFLERYPQARQLGEPRGKGADGAIVPWTFIGNVPAQTGEYALTQEAFCGVLAEVSLDAEDAGSFLAQAVQFANQQVWGNLSCTMLIDPATERQYTVELDQAIAALRYGVIGLNLWSGVIFSIPSLPWGAFPGNPLTDISSGRGVVHNTYLFEHPQKSVVRAPFRIVPAPVWMARRPNLLTLAKRLTNFQANPSWRNGLGVIWAAMQR